MKKILIMGLPGSGKTTLASELVPMLKAKWINNDEVRKEANDWDFSEEGRSRQAKRMANLAEKEKQEGKRGAASVERRHLSVSEEENKFSLKSFQL